MCKTGEVPMGVLRAAGAFAALGNDMICAVQAQCPAHARIDVLPGLPACLQDAARVAPEYELDELTDEWQSTLQTIDDHLFHVRCECASSTCMCSIA